MSSIRNTRLLFLGAACLGALAACGGSDPVSSGSDAAPAAQLACDAYTGPAPDSLLRLRGGIHAHSSYSDGDIHSIPANYYANAAANGLDFFAGTEHSDTYDPNIFVSTGGDCFTTPDNLLTCLTPNDDKLRKWAATAEQATAATTPVFTPLRGFEWTSDRFGHINVLFSADITNAKIDGGYVDMASFYDWLTRDAGAGWRQRRHRHFQPSQRQEAQRQRSRPQLEPAGACRRGGYADGRHGVVQQRRAR